MKLMQRIHNIFKKQAQQPGNVQEPTDTMSKTTLPKYWTPKKWTDDSVVYGLVDIEGGDVVYVGVTYDIELRFRQHYGSRTIDNSALANWCLDQRNKYGGLYYVLLDGPLPFEEAYKRETYWIKFYLQQGYTLLNIAKCPIKRPIKK
jgi:GIY-YIG catalytic domain